MNLIEENQKLKSEIEFLRKKEKEWQKKYYELLNELKKTQALLRQFLNENTPSSKLPFKYPSKEQSEKELKPSGKPLGGNGGNKKDPKNVDRIIKAKHDKRCHRCGKIILRKNIDTRLRYVYDAILKAVVIELKFNFSGSYANISKFFDNVTNGKINFTPKAINDCISGIAEKLELSYDEIENQLKNEDYAHSDETSWPVNGVLWYLWMFVTAKFVFIKIQNSRARKVLIEIFGEDYHGGIISDCYKVYDNFAEWYQKCWAHLLRKAKF